MTTPNLKPGTFCIRAPKLTIREYQVIRLSCYTVADMANILGIGIGTVNTHIARAKEKLGARNRFELLVIALRMGYLTIENVEIPE